MRFYPGASKSPLSGVLLFFLFFFCSVPVTFFCSFFFGRSSPLDSILCFCRSASTSKVEAEPAAIGHLFQDEGVKSTTVFGALWNAVESALERFFSLFFFPAFLFRGRKKGNTRRGGQFFNCVPSVRGRGRGRLCWNSRFFFFGKNCDFGFTGFVS